MQPVKTIKIVLHIMKNVMNTLYCVKTLFKNILWHLSNIRWHVIGGFLIPTILLSSRCMWMQCGCRTKFKQQWLKIFYKYPSACIINNGYPWQSLKIEKGVRQECPLSSFLFITSLELLSISIIKTRTSTV